MLYVFSFRMSIAVFLAFVFIAGRLCVANALTSQKNVSSGVQTIKEIISVDPNLKYEVIGSEAGLSTELDREILNLSISEDLTISDYFAGYLTRQVSLGTVIKDISLRLTPEEVVELMSSRAQNLRKPIYLLAP